LKRRRVFRVMVGYGIFAFAVLQVIEPIMHGAGLPDWVLKSVLVALAAGFPVALILSWLFDLTSQGVRRTPSNALAGGIHFSRRRLAGLLIAAGLVGALPGVGWYFWKMSGERGQEGPAGPITPSVAVLPFANMSADKDQEYFADGVAEEILNALAHVEGLRVIGRTSSFYFKGRNEDLPAIARKLAVGAVLEGSVRKEGNRVRVTAQLLDTTDGSHLWSETYERELRSVFQVQEEIAHAVVAALKLRLLPGQALTMRGSRTNITEAYNLVLRSRFVLSALNRDGYRRAHELLEKAAALDPAYAAPHADMALTLRMMASFAENPEEWAALRARALAEAERAVSLGPDLDDAYSIRGLLRTIFLRDWAGAEADLRRALTLGPSNAGALRRLGILQADLGRLDEGIETLRRSTELDPLKAATWNWLGILETGAGRFDTARASLGRARELAPDSPEPRASLADLEILTGHPSEALGLVPALAEHALGHEKESRRALDELVARFGHSDAPLIAEVHAWRGEATQAFEWLDRALGQEFEGVKYDPYLRSLRGDPRYAQLLKRMNLPPD
jgi:TolB-like protein/Flp pilus assembly protein TadD